MAKIIQPGFQTQSAGYLANHMARLFALVLAQAIRPLGLAPAQFMVLLELWREEGLTQSDLVLRLDVEQATMASTLDRMERDGLIVRRPRPSDSRAQSINLTERARGLQAQAIQAARSVNALALSGLTETERAQLLTLMPRVIGALKAQRAKTPRSKRATAERR
jgi:DNA-binding MarR family transcriptional regulator